MKKTILLSTVLLALVSGAILANRKLGDETNPSIKTPHPVQRKSNLDEKKKWDASPDGSNYKAWTISPEGRKVFASYNLIQRHINDFTEMQATVTSTTFQRVNAKSNGPKWLVVKINGENYMMQFSAKQFRHLKVDDEITVKSRSASCSPNHPYLILSGDYIARDNTIIFEQDLRNKKGC